VSLLGLLLPAGFLASAPVQNPLFGFVLMAAFGAASMELIGLRRARELGLATGMLLCGGVLGPPA